MKFYGTKDSLVSWKEIIDNEFPVNCGPIRTQKSRFGDRLYFIVNLTTDQRAALQEFYWYETEEGQEYPWNHRIAYEL